MRCTDFVNKNSKNCHDEFQNYKYQQIKTKIKRLMTKTLQILETLTSSLEFVPNKDQLQALKHLSAFIDNSGTEQFFILTGPAGSGKTSLVKSLVNYFENTDTGFYLASPTGRSAQILGKKTNSYATTLHSLLFKPEFDENTMQVSFKPKYNTKHSDSRFFIVDEASMISDHTNNMGMFIQQTSLLHQLINYARQGNPNNKIVFIGDRYQLPPVGSDFSPALSEEYIRQKFNLNGSGYELNMVERQKNDSYILKAANDILNSILNNSGYNLPFFRGVSSFSASIYKYLADFNNYDKDYSVMIAFSNAQVNALNEYARKFRYHYNISREIMDGELMICNSNCLINDTLLAKGNHFVVLNTWKPEEFADLHFINAEIEFENLNNERIKAKTKILLESVSSKDGNISYDAEKKLHHEAFRKNKKFRETRNPKDDAFVNAVRARYGYALTCHKAQGGEWKNVYLHPGYQKNNLRWLYTAITRAVQDLFSWTN